MEGWALALEETTRLSTATGGWELAFRAAEPFKGEDPNTLLDYYRRMVLIRRFEEKAAELYARGEIGGFLHLAIGEEPVAVGAIAALRDDDHVITHYRDHGHALARGLDPKGLMAELCGRATGCCKGRGGSMHLADVSKRFWGGYGIVGVHVALAAGLGLAEVYQRDSDRVVLCLFGDGATNTGEFHEALNMASLWRLPVIYLCENNLYGMGTAVERASAVRQIYRKAAAYDMVGERIDGMDPLVVRDAVAVAAERARRDGGPTLIEALTYRFRGHSVADPELYRSKEEVEQYKRRDPIVAFRRRLEAAGIGSPQVFDQIDQAVSQEVEEAAAFALESPLPERQSLYDYVYAEPIPEAGPSGGVENG